MTYAYASAPSRVARVALPLLAASFGCSPTPIPGPPGEPVPVTLRTDENPLRPPPDAVAVQDGDEAWTLLGSDGRFEVTDPEGRYGVALSCEFTMVLVYATVDELPSPSLNCSNLWHDDSLLADLDIEIGDSEGPYDVTAALGPGEFVGQLPGQSYPLATPSGSYDGVLLLWEQDAPDDAEPRIALRRDVTVEVGPGELAFDLALDEVPGETRTTDTTPEAAEFDVFSSLMLISRGGTTLSMPAAEGSAAWTVPAAATLVDGDQLMLQSGAYRSGAYVSVSHAPRPATEPLPTVDLPEPLDGGLRSAWDEPLTFSWPADTGSLYIASFMDAEMLGRWTVAATPGRPEVGSGIHLPALELLSPPSLSIGVAGFELTVIDGPNGEPIVGDALRNLLRLRVHGDPAWNDGDLGLAQMTGVDLADLAHRERGVDYEVSAR